MNNIYKVRWNKVKALWECVSETSKNVVRRKKAVFVMSLGLLSISTLTSEVVAGDINEPYFILENGYVDIHHNPGYGGYFDEKGSYHFGDGNQLANSSTFTRDFLENFATTYKNDKLSAEQTQLPFRVRVTPGPHVTHPLLMDNQYHLLEG